MTLSDFDRSILDFEGELWVHRAAREQAARERFEMTATRYAQHLIGLLDDPAALAYAPLTVKRLQRIRDRRKGAWVKVQ